MYPVDCINQNYLNLLEQAGDAGKVMVVIISLSPQSRASLAVEHKLGDAQQVL